MAINLKADKILCSKSEDAVTESSTHRSAPTRLSKPNRAQLHRHNLLPPIQCALTKRTDVRNLYASFPLVRTLSSLERKPLDGTLIYTNYIMSISTPSLERKLSTLLILMYFQILKFTRQYREYMQKLLEYLIYFFERTEPLQDLQRIFSKVTSEFEEQWNSGLFQGWLNENHENGNIKQLEAMIDLDYYSTVDQLMEVGPEKLKEALSALGLKTGGTVQQRAERLFLTKNTPLEKLDHKHFPKGSRGYQQKGVVAPQPSEDEKEIALMEAKMKKLCDLLEELVLHQELDKLISLFGCKIDGYHA